MNTDDILIESFKKTGQVFLNPQTICLWDEIITGPYVTRDDRLKNIIKNVALNTANVFYKNNKDKQIL
jgi:hypothetical protein